MLPQIPEGRCGEGTKLKQPALPSRPCPSSFSLSAAEGPGARLEELGVLLEMHLGQGRGSHPSPPPLRGHIHFSSQTCIIRSEVSLLSHSSPTFVHVSRGPALIGGVFYSNSRFQASRELRLFIQ